MRPIDPNLVQWINTVFTQILAVIGFVVGRVLLEWIRKTKKEIEDKPKIYRPGDSFPDTKTAKRKNFYFEFVECMRPPVILAFTFILVAGGIAGYFIGWPTTKIIDSLGLPIVQIVGLRPDYYVTIQAENFPVKDNFDIIIGATEENGIVVGAVSTQLEDAFEYTLAIPEEFNGSDKLTVYLSGQNTEYSTSVWFYNKTPYVGVPSFAISAVQRDTNVTVSFTNMPPNDTFWVRMNYFETEGVAGAVVSTISTGPGGSVSDVTFPIPEFLKGSYKIAIRVESPITGYYAKNWFYNNDAP